jgi:GTP 3',8-cyclase
MTLQDQHGRNIDYLRISLTPKCNFNCFYCRPMGDCLPENYPVPLRKKEIEKIVKVAAGLGVTKIRLTGGEPMLKPDLLAIVRLIAATEGISDISLTTNGFFLAKKAAALKKAGLNRVNISLDSLNDERFRKITGGGRLDRIKAGMDAAIRAGLTPLKINMVVIKGVNDDEIKDFAALTLDRDIHIRFIEYMPLGDGHGDWQGQYLSVKDIMGACRSLGPLEKVDKVQGNGPARYYRLAGSKGVLGFISPISEHFCQTCNRFRVTSDGMLKPCLFSGEELNLRKAMGDEEALKQLFQDALKIKPSPENPPYLCQDLCAGSRVRGMVEIGG